MQMTAESRSKARITKVILQITENENKSEGTR